MAFERNDSATFAYLCVISELNHLFHITATYKTQLGLGYRPMHKQNLYYF